jgi:hypothetical protein
VKTLPSMVTEPNWVRSILGCIVHLIPGLASGERPYTDHAELAARRGFQQTGTVTPEVLARRTLMPYPSWLHPDGVDDPRQPTTFADDAGAAGALAAVIADMSGGAQDLSELGSQQGPSTKTTAAPWIANPSAANPASSPSWSHT